MSLFKATSYAQVAEESQWITRRLSQDGTHIVRLVGPVHRARVHWISYPEGGFGREICAQSLGQSSCRLCELAVADTFRDAVGAAREYGAGWALFLNELDPEEASQNRQVPLIAILELPRRDCRVIGELLKQAGRLADDDPRLAQLIQLRDQIWQFIAQQGQFNPQEVEIPDWLQNVSDLGSGIQGIVIQIQVQRQGRNPQRTITPASTQPHLLSAEDAWRIYQKSLKGHSPDASLLGFTPDAPTPEAVLPVVMQRHSEVETRLREQLNAPAIMGTGVTLNDALEAQAQVEGAASTLEQALGGAAQNGGGPTPLTTTPSEGLGLIGGTSTTQSDGVQAPQPTAPTPQQPATSTTLPTPPATTVPPAGTLQPPAQPSSTTLATEATDDDDAPVY